MENKEYLNIDKSKFQFVQDKEIKDLKFDTKPIGYYQDAWRRFKKNKASVVAAWIILFLILYAVIVPILSPYDVSFSDGEYKNALPKLFNAGTGFWDGAKNESMSEVNYHFYRGVGVEYELWKGIDKPAESRGVGSDGARNAIVKKGKTQTDAATGKKSITARRDSYLMKGFVYKEIGYSEYLAIQEYQNETGNRIIYPMVSYQKIGAVDRLCASNANYWFQYTANVVAGVGEATNSVNIVFDKNGEFIPNYAIYDDLEQNQLSYYYAPYNSIRQPGDPGVDAGGDIHGVSYSYARIVNSNFGSPLEQCSFKVRVCYYDYFIYKNGRQPRFLFGLNGVGRDLFVCIAYGARTSFLLSISITAINLILGAFIGAWIGYRGGWTDLVVQRIMEIISAIPMVVAIVLFQKHLQAVLGVVGVIVFAFVFSGWLGMADRTRIQFYRYKNHEYVLAARTLGAKDGRLMFKHIFPNAIGTLITGSILAIPSFVFSESYFSYLGIIDLEGPKSTSLGTLLANGQQSMQYFPHGLFFVAIFISLLMIAFNLFGNGLRDAFNPNLRGTGE